MSELGTNFETITECRSCRSGDLRLVLDLGNMPLADGLVRAGSDRETEVVYPLTVVWCPSCSLVQILETVDPGTLFGEEYPYYSSFSPALVEHSRRTVEKLIDETDVGPDSLVVELASNDGYLLQWFVKEGIPVLGIDPAPGPAKEATGRGVPTICDFFTPALAASLVESGQSADLIIGNNVLAHVPDQNEFAAGIARLLKADGMVVMEFPYVVDLVTRTEFDTIYHEHHCYFSVLSVQHLFRQHGLELVRVEHIDIHGGSLRVFLSKNGEPDESVARFLEEEKRAGVDQLMFYESFAEDVDEVRQQLGELLGGLRRDGSTIVAYGAAAKGAILLNYCGIDDSHIEYVVDRNHHKHGWEMPGVPLEVFGPEKLKDVTPDYILILPWNFEDEITDQQRWFSEQGGRFIVPIPRPTLR